MIEAASRVIWVIDHLADVRSDMSVFHRIDDLEAMGSERLFELAQRLYCYRGAIRERMTEEAQTEQHQRTTAGAPLTRQLVQSDPGLRGAIEFTQVKAE